MEKSFLIGLILALLIATGFFLNAYLDISSGKYRGDDYYISDEVWYATASRNLLNELFKYNARYVRDGYAYATLVFPSKEYLENNLSEISECLSSLGGSIVRSNYTTTGDKIPALWVKVPQPNISRLRYCDDVERVRTGFEYPSKSGIYDYLNLEHPPLGKYLIMLSMILLGDRPISWRIPGLIEAFFMIIIVYLAGSRILNPLWGVIASLSLALDPMFKAMSMVAMLDIHLAFFTSLAILLVVYDRPLAASIAAWLAFSVKFSGLFVVFAIYLYLRIYRKEKVASSLLKSLVPALLYPLVSMPLIIHFGLGEWIQENLSAIAWHTTSRGSGPVPSPPWGWFFNIAPMALHYNPDLIARVNLVSYSIAFLFMIALLPALIERRRDYIPMLFVASIVLGYTGVFIKGNRTLYSFYAVQLSPAVALSFSSALFYLTIRERELDRYLNSGWRRIFGALLGREEIPLPGELSFLKVFLDMDRRSLALIIAAIISVFSSLILYYMALLPQSPAALISLEDYGLSNVLTRYLGQISSEMWIRGLIYSSLILLSSLIFSLDSRELAQKLEYMPILALLFLSGSDWTLLSLALALDGLLFISRGRRLVGSLLVGLASALNPLNLALSTVVISRRRKKDILALMLGLLILSPIRGFFNWPKDVIGGILWPLVGLYSVLIGALAAGVVVVLLSRKGYEESVLAMGLFLLVAGGRPSWALIPLSLMLMAGSSTSTSITEVFAIIPALTWTVPGMISGPLFKCNPSGPTSPCSDPFISMTIFSILLIYWGARRHAEKSLS